MKREEVREFLKEGVNGLVPAPEFGSGLVTDFNSIRSHEYPAVWQVVSPVGTVEGTSAPQDSWEIELIVAKKDRIDSSPDEYNPMLDECDLIAQKLAYKYRKIVDGYKLVTMESIRREPFVKRYADCLSGVMLTFTLNVPNQTNVC